MTYKIFFPNDMIKQVLFIHFSQIKPVKNPRNHCVLMWQKHMEFQMLLAGCILLFDSVVRRFD